MPDVWYVAGDGLLVGADRRWLLLGDTPDDAFVSSLWETITGSGVDRVLGLLESHYGSSIPSLAMTGAGREITRGSGEVTNDRVGVMLSLGPSASSSVATGKRRPFRGGVVGASLVEIPADLPAGREEGRAVIDGIPQEVLEAIGPDVPLRARLTARAAQASSPGNAAPVAPTTESPAETPAASADDLYQTGHRLEPVDAAVTGPIGLTREPPELVEAADIDQGQTVVRSRDAGAGPPVPVPAPELELLKGHTHETVMATYCPQGHVNPPYAPTCRVCQQPISRQDPQRAPRPLLGRLRLPTGETVPFDRGVVLGRKPVPVNPHAPAPHLVAVPQEASFVSRMHLQIELDGWLVICRDLGSRGGTTLTMPGRPSERLRPMEPHVLEPGCRVSLSDQYEVTYEVVP
ncbi:MAG: FHA domain-containing protein [Nocardioides sp.]